MVAWSLKCNIWSYIFLDFHEPGDDSKKSISHAQHTIFISTECPFHTLGLQRAIFQYTICKNFIGLQRSIGQQKRCNLELKNS